MTGFSLHAAVHCGADHRHSSWRLCGYITRPALANDRVQGNAADQGFQNLLPPWHDGSKPLVTSLLGNMSDRLRERHGYAGHSAV